MSLGLTAAVVGGLVLVPLFDAKGAAVAAVLAELVNAGAAFVALRRAGPGRELHFGWVPRALLVGALGLGAGLACPGPDAVGTVAGAVAFVLAAIVLRLVPPEVLQAVRRQRPAA